MLQYIIRRILIAIPTLLIISFVIFAVLALAPGDPLAQFALNPAIPESTRELIRIQFGLDQPWPVRYVRWLTSLMRGDWGFSFGTRGPVIDLIWQRLPQTLTVVGTAYLIAVVLAIPIGIISAVKQYSIFDNVATFFAFVGFSVPSFFTGLVLMLVFAINLKWFPIVYNTTLQVVDWDTFTQQVRQMTLPVTVLVVQQTAALTRFMRSSMLDNLNLDYVRTARAKGLSDRMVVLRHVLVNSLIPVVTLIALGIPTIFAGAIITENLFRVNGLGALLITSINNSDTPVVMALTFIFAILTVVFNLIADILYGVLDPRVRYS
ncbi:ABC transporter permease [Chloroflexus sp.]|uniref:ABC transporter permease n=1 Tax=Chloroflexus sp. TaxID=1904827 RepID=UPI00298F250F|nr:ABC transporter permease [Chloroflexus sp.]MCS6886842.1 ABC transporter permease [Chloroflexus sp.]MCX7860244.1 ABC transporter permease [Chloroflexus sp.]MDW8405512.1 ABC transporter permease [Chloroflexus sp.]